MSFRNSLVLAVDVITFVTGLPTNALAFYILSRKVRQKATPIDILLLNLTISHLLFLLFLPFKMKEAADDMAWNTHPHLCPLTNFVFHTTIYNSTLFLTAISVQRYLGAAFPVQYKLKKRPLYAVVTAVFVWLISMGHISIVYIMQFFHSKSITPVSGAACYENFTKEQLDVLLPVRFEIFLVLFLVPGIICTFCYIKLVLILTRLPNINPRKRLYAIGLALTTLLVFIVCFSPHNLSHVVGFITKKSPPWRANALICSTVNACLDPILYYFSSSVLRSTSKDIHWRMGRRMKKLCCCPRDTDDPQPTGRPQSTNDFTEESTAKL